MRIVLEVDCTKKEFREWLEALESELKAGTMMLLSHRVNQPVPERLSEIGDEVFAQLRRIAKEGE